MAPAISIGVATPSSSSSSSGAGRKGRGGVVAVGVEEAELLRRRNAELEREVAALRAELCAARRRAETAEEAEERLCAQLGDAEVEAVEIALEYQARVEGLARELAAARRAAPAAAGSS
jgi:predicted RNase H-like nuclease (RuvC/YqgF family)